MTIRRVLLTLLAAFGVAACGSPGPTQLPLGPVPDGEMSLTASNQSDRALELFVNGSKITDVPATTSSTFAASDPPPLPWAAELRLPTGRTLLSLTITSGSVVRYQAGEGIGTRSPGIRADLSCGRIELWSLVPLMGPPPGPGRPGDCGP